MQLEVLYRQVALIEKAKHKIELAMSHASPRSVNALRQQKEELDYLLNVFMDSCVLSNTDLPSLLSANSDCVRDCFRPEFNKKPVILPKPQWDTPPAPEKPPVATVPGVNLIVYVDTSGSMRGPLSPTGKVRKELINFANYLKTQSTAANIPCTVSLIWFGDATDSGGDGRNSYYTIAMNKQDVSSFPSKVAAPTWYRGGATPPESGILCMKETIDQVYKSGVQNTLIYVTDAASKSNEGNATPAHMKNVFNNKKIQAYGIIPKSKTPNITGIFQDTREYTLRAYDIVAWANKTLRP
ncbi:VWA domain-containing protein (plasmid) [Paenibacillus peoriae]|uniref:VWA domain-containing protein n=1 Tax=Paenibacillus peoriae TaxID=59893 RepID=A0A7H0YH30_9BACL|nr:VWA domain-containing protein [Paenibacillus peoriae]QNR70388.1 VWA domain-containing protein [Paenibacillus peoriae]